MDMISLTRKYIAGLKNPADLRNEMLGFYFDRDTKSFIVFRSRDQDRKTFAIREVFATFKKLADVEALSVSCHNHLKLSA